MTRSSGAGPLLPFTILCLALLLLSGCQTRSISATGYHDRYHPSRELNELSVLGVSMDATISEDSIQRARDERRDVTIQRGSRVAVIQSGAAFPDASLINHLNPHFSVIPLSGIPPEHQGANVGANGSQVTEGTQQPISRSLRLAAARGGADTLIVYWGVLESGREAKGTKLVSWTPIVGSIVPDESQSMRIRLKAAIIDVDSGAWRMLTPDVYEDQITSSPLTRYQRDQEQIAQLKDLAYKRLAADLQLIAM